MEEEILDPTLTKDRENCPVCSEKDFNSSFLKEGFRYVICTHCGLVYVKNILRNNVHLEDDQHDVPEKVFKKEDFPSCGDRYKRSQRILSVIKRYFGHRRDILLLDVGSGMGFSLQFMKEHGYPNVRGLDINAKSIQFTKHTLGIEAEQGSIEEGDCYLDESFDVIIMDQVLEHLEKPNLALKNSFRLLKSSGLLWVSTPNIYSWHILWRLKQFHRHFTGSGHLNHFSPKTLRATIEKQEFQVDKVITRIEEMTLARLKGVFLHPEDFDRSFFKRTQKTKSTFKEFSSARAATKKEMSPIFLKMKSLLMLPFDIILVLITRALNLAAYIELTARKP